MNAEHKTAIDLHGFNTALLSQSIDCLNTHSWCIVEKTWQVGEMHFSVGKHCVCPEIKTLLLLGDGKKISNTTSNKAARAFAMATALSCVMYQSRDTFIV